MHPQLVQLGNQKDPTIGREIGAIRQDPLPGKRGRPSAQPVCAGVACCLLGARWRPTVKIDYVAAPAAPRSHHLDKRAQALLASSADADELLTTAETAEWLGVSIQFLEIGRCRGHDYGPPFVRLSRRCVRYRRGDVQAWLRERTHALTGAGSDPQEPAAGGV